MMISTKGRYALKVMIDLAAHSGEGLIPLKEITERLNMSLKYVESIMSVLSKGHMVESASGKHGGYRLTREPNQYTVGEILRLAEGDLLPVSCNGLHEDVCENADSCYTFPFWNGLNQVINEYLDSHTLADLVNKNNN